MGNGGQHRSLGAASMPRASAWLCLCACACAACMCLCHVPVPLGLCVPWACARLHKPTNARTGPAAQRRTHRQARRQTGGLCYASTCRPEPARPSVTQMMRTSRGAALLASPATLHNSVPPSGKPCVLAHGWNTLAPGHTAPHLHAGPVVRHLPPVVAGLRVCGGEEACGRGGGEHPMCVCAECKEIVWGQTWHNLKLLPSLPRSGGSCIPTLIPPPCMHAHAP